MERVLAIDVGTNTVLGAVGERHGGALSILADEERIVGLGRGVDRDRRLRPDRIEAALEAGADDVANEGELFVVTTEPAALHAVKEGLESQKYKVEDAELAWVPKNTVKVDGDNAAALLRLLEALEELDDVQKVDANFEMDESAMAGA